MGPVTVGVDIGQKVDPTAIAVNEIEWRRDDGGKRVDYHIIRHLERLTLGTPYPRVAERLGEVIAGVRRRAAAPTARAPSVVFDPAITAYKAVGGQASGLSLKIYVDATGVGQPVVDLLAQAGVKVRPVYFTYGDRRTEEDGGRITLGKAWLVSRLQALLQTGRILLPQTAEARALAKELMDYEIKVDQDANDKYGAFKVGTHDDLVTALGLAVQDVGRVPGSPVAGGVRTGFRPAPLPRRVR